MPQISDEWRKSSRKKISIWNKIAGWSIFFSSFRMLLRASHNLAQTVHGDGGQGPKTMGYALHIVQLHTRPCDRNAQWERLPGLWLADRYGPKSTQSIAKCIQPIGIIAIYSHQCSILGVAHNMNINQPNDKCLRIYEQNRIATNYIAIAKNEAHRRNAINHIASPRSWMCMYIYVRPFPRQPNWSQCD